jgi:hypothetical protein
LLQANLATYGAILAVSRGISYRHRFSFNVVISPQFHFCINLHVAISDRKIGGCFFAKINPHYLSGVYIKIVKISLKILKDTIFIDIDQLVVKILRIPTYVVEMPKTEEYLARRTQRDSPQIQVLR